MGIVGCEQFAVGEDEEYRSRGEREYARCRIAEYSSLRFAGVSGGLPPGSEELKKETFFSREAILLFLPMNAYM